jgi:hypothetical protein
MPTRIREIMTPDPIIMQASDTAVEAARVMRDEGIGDVSASTRKASYGEIPPDHSGKCFACLLRCR